MKNFKLLALLTIIAFAFTQCSESEFESSSAVEVDYSSYPLALGNEWIYRVDSLEISRSGTIIDQSSTQVKEVITREIRNTDTEKIYQLSRFYRNNSNDAWQERDQWQIGISGTKAFKTINNVKEVKLTFPIQAKKAWSGHQYVDPNRSITVGNNSWEYYKNWSPEITSTGRKFGDYNDVTNVEYVDVDNFLEFENINEKYAKNIGLVYSKAEYLKIIDQVTDTRPWSEKEPDIGFKITHTLLDYTIN